MSSQGMNGYTKQTLVYTENGLLVFKRKGILTHATTWMKLEAIPSINKISKSQKTNNILLHLHEISKVVKFTESRMRVAISRGEENELFNG